MLNILIGTKKEMTQRFNKRGHLVATSIIKVEPNIIFVARDSRLQLTAIPKKKSKKTENAYTTALKYAPKIIREIKIKDHNLKTADKVDVSIFEPLDLVKVTGITKGKGFAGGVKRWGFHGGPKTHGQSDRHRAPGSIGQTTTPARVFKGKHMAGHMGVAKKTITNLEILEVDPANNLIFIKGAVPGPTNGTLIIEKTGKAKSYTPPPPPSEEKQEEKAEAESKVKEETKEPNGPKETKGQEQSPAEKSDQGVKK